MESNFDHSRDIRSKQGRKVMRRGVTPLKVSAAKNYAGCSITYPSASVANLGTILDSFRQRENHLEQSMLPVSVLAL